MVACLSYLSARAENFHNIWKTGDCGMSNANCCRSFAAVRYPQQMLDGCSSENACGCLVDVLMPVIGNGMCAVDEQHIH